MKSKKFKVVISALLVVLCIGVLTIGAYAAVKINSSVSGNVGYEYDATKHVIAEIGYKSEGAATDIENGSVQYIGTVEEAAKPINLGKLAFASTVENGATITVTFTITNNQAVENGSNLVVALSGIPQDTDNLTVDCDYTEALIVTPGESATITLTFTLVSNIASAALNLSGFSIDLSLPKQA